MAWVLRKKAFVEEEVQMLLKSSLKRHNLALQHFASGPFSVSQSKPIQPSQAQAHQAPLNWKPQEECFPDHRRWPTHGTCPSLFFMAWIFGLLALCAPALSKRLSLESTSSCSPGGVLW